MNRLRDDGDINGPTEADDKPRLASVLFARAQVRRGGGQWNIVRTRTPQIGDMGLLKELGGRVTPAGHRSILEPHDR